MSCIVEFWITEAWECGYDGEEEKSRKKNP
jgi:hypothetical protein